MPDTPQRYFPNGRSRVLWLSPAGLSQLVEFIRDSFQLDPAGRPQDLGAGIYGVSRFYRAKQSYHLFRTCNHWTARALGQAGIAITPAYVFTVDQLFNQLNEARPSS